jgi:hypothetical protein
MGEKGVRGLEMLFAKAHARGILTDIPKIQLV